MIDSDLELPAHSKSYSLYFEKLSKEVERIYSIAKAARQKGYDPSLDVEIPPAHDVAARVEATLDGPIGVAARIRELQKEKSREAVAFIVAKEIAMGELGGIKDREKAADKAVRVALSILTESITAAPLEGIAKVKIRGSGSDEYLAIYLAGPIRAAGGTEAAMTVLVADYVRQVLGIPPFKPTEEEVERALEEVEMYARAVHLQFPVHPDLIRFAASRLPIMLTGEPTEEYEVSGTRDLDRIETNRVRGGAVLVLTEGVVGRAAKLLRIVESLDIPGWEWLKDIKEKKPAEKSKSTDPDTAIAPKPDYLADVIGGRPVFSHPMRPGGFRLRYGRSRNTGLAGVGVHPATMYVVEEFLAPGTHIRTERPGKGSIVTPVDSIEGPIVLLKDGTVKQLSDPDEAKSLSDKIERILYLGDILIALGEFLENNHPLAPPGYCEEWWSHDLHEMCNSLSFSNLNRALQNINITKEEIDQFIMFPLTHIPTPEQAILLSKEIGVPLHPRYTYRWKALAVDEAKSLRDWMVKEHKIEQTSTGSLMVLPLDIRQKHTLERLGVPHTLNAKRTHIIMSDSPLTILAQIGKGKSSHDHDDSLEFINQVSEIHIKDKLGLSIGARMGRPEKAEARKMKPPVNVLFPVGRTRGSERRIEAIAKSSQQTETLDSFGQGVPNTSSSGTSTGGISVEMVSRFCANCNLVTFESRCSSCGTYTEVQYYCSQERCGLPIDSRSGMCPNKHDVNLIRATRKYEIDINDLLNRVKAEIDEPQSYNLRGVLGLTSELKTPEYIGKGILRAKHEVFCYRDGTARFDITDAPLTHFTPKEVGVDIKTLRELGYIVDYKGNPLVSEDQILELKVQDIIVPDTCADYLMRIGNFVDDCLEKIYGFERYYNFSTPKDVVGQVVIGLAPHTSAGIIGRIVGFTSASICYAHPYWHAAKRRNCDGDEDAVILLMDALLNFSKSYLPAGRGGFMDAPLVLSVILNPSEVDDEAHNMEVCERYPAQFYELASLSQSQKSAEALVDNIHSRIGTEAQYEGFKFTHSTSCIDSGPLNTRYKILDSMAEKLEAQLHLASIIDAVDACDVAERVLSTHFLRDIRGNLRAYSTQKVQCRKCHRVYRRPPLSGKCICGSDLALTVRQKNISKYLSVAEKLISDHGLGPYLQERLRLINTSLASLFLSEQTSILDFFDSDESE